MKWIVRIVGLVLALPLAYLAILYGASELGGEVVLLDKALDDGSIRQVRIWIVENEDGAWIEHGDPDAPYIRKLSTDPALTIKRAGVSQRYSATPDPDAHQLYHELRNEKYGAAASIIALLTGGEEDCPGLPIRLAPLS